MRRHYGWAVFVFLVILFTTTISAQTPVRMSWQTFAKDPARVAAFRKAVAMMKRHDLAAPATPESRMGWEYWGNMHGYFGPKSTFGTIMQFVNKRKIDLSIYSLYFYGVHNLVLPDAVAEAVWSQCQHGTGYFFPWHRLYLLYFEQQLQKAANDPTLRLPYWDYTDTANLAMPAEFTMPTYVDAAGEVQPNPLYETRRAPGWLTPPVQSLDPDLTNIDKALPIPLFFDTVDSSGKKVPGYQSTIEGGVHGNVHCSVMDCPVPVMGAVGYSSNDPIFYLHHANIDRMWNCWTNLPGHKNPDDPTYLGKTFSYIDANGMEVTKTVNDIINGHMVDYVYEQTSNCARPKAAAPLAAAPAVKPMSAKDVKSARVALAKAVVLAHMDGVSINAPTTKKSLTLPAATPANAKMRSLTLTAHAEIPQETDLELRGIHFDGHPNTMFKVYLEQKDDPSKRVLVGTLSFFETSGEASDSNTAETDHVFDVTKELQSLGGETMQEITVTFEAVNGRIGAGKKAAMNPSANLVVDSIELRAKLRPEAK